MGKESNTTVGQGVLVAGTVRSFHIVYCPETTHLWENKGKAPEEKGISLLLHHITVA